jgi:hypothetical protein
MVIIFYYDDMYTINIGQEHHKFNICLQLQYIQIKHQSHHFYQRERPPSY